MKKRTIIILITIPLTIFGCYWYSTYRTLKNPFDEMIYSETSQVNIMPYRRLNKVIGSNSHFSRDLVFISLNYTKSINIDETLHARVGDHGISFDYSLQLNNNNKLNMYFSYNETKKLLEEKNMYIDEINTTYKGQTLLDYLKKQGKDRNWLKKQSHKVVEDYILGTWFKHGSHRYSLDNLGELTIKYDPILEENTNQAD